MKTAIKKMPPKETGEKKMWSLRLSRQHKERLKAIAEREGQGQTDVLRYLIDVYFDAHLKGAPRSARKSRPSA